MTLIYRLGRDTRVTDLRCMAYMLATACHEAREIKKCQVPQVGKSGKTGRKYSFQMNSVTFNNNKVRCNLDRTAHSIGSLRR